MMSRRLTWLLVALLLGGAALYWAKGVSLLFGERGGVDVHLRWQDQQYVMRGQNPYDVLHAELGVGPAPWDPTRNAAPVPEIGVPDSGGYPPWSFVLGYLMFWPPWPAVKVYFLIISLAMLGVIGVWASRVVRPRGTGSAASWLAVAAVLAISGNSTSVHVGQHGGVVVGLLALSAWALCAGRDIGGGVLMGMALVKPTIAGPFVLVLLAIGRWRALSACVGYVALASGFIWWQTSTNPIEMLLQSLSAGAEYIHDSQGLVNVLLRLGVTPQRVTPILAATVALPGCAVLLAARHRPLIDLFAIAAVIGRLWAYHKTYDNIMLTFLLVATLSAALTSRSRIAVAGFFVTGLAAWAPASLSKNEPFLFFQLFCWVGGLVALLATPSRCDETVAEGSAPAVPLDHQGD